MDSFIAAKKEKLEALLGRLERVAVAFSAGVDSTFLLQTAHDVLGDNVLAVTGRSVLMPREETDEAGSFCRTHGVRHMFVDVDPLSIEGFAENPPNRCYLCKMALFRSFLEVAQQTGFPVLIEGSNADDTSDYRPGMQALQELMIRSPLREAGLTKAEIRALSRDMGLPTWDKPSLACLATRIPYGEAITTQKLAVIDEAERLLRKNGFRQVRVRMHGKLARIEIESSKFQAFLEPVFSALVQQRFSELGFAYTTLDLHGFQSGSMNKTIV